MSYSGPSVNAPYVRYFKIISRWRRTAKSTVDCNLLIISTGLCQGMIKRQLLRRKSYRFILSKLSFHSVKAITLHRESYAFTEVGEQNGQDKPCFSYFYSGNSSGSRFFVDKISKAKSPKCPILCTYVITPFIIVSMSCLL